MKLLLMKAPRHGQTDMVLQTSRGIHSLEIGKTHEFSDEEAHEILAGPFGFCFSKSTISEAAPVKAATKVMSKTKKDSRVDDEALEEATKMVDDYVVKG